MTILCNSKRSIFFLHFIHRFNSFFAIFIEAISDRYKCLRSAQFDKNWVKLYTCLYQLWCAKAKI